MAAGEQCLLAVSGDGTLSVTDLRTGKVSAPPVKRLGWRYVQTSDMWAGGGSCDASAVRCWCCMARHVAV